LPKSDRLDYPWCFFKASEDRERKRDREKNEFCSEMLAMAKAVTARPKPKKQAQNPQSNTPLFLLHKMVSFQ
jgi:hypothetical protein